ncbi:MAG: fatty acid desaturase [Acidobacteriota bacterium]
MNLLWMFIITVVILQTSVFITTIYLHRSQCHRGLELHPFIANLMHLHLSLFTGIVPREWVAVHRKHHHFSDKEGDPHSPYLFGLWTVFFGNYFMYRKEIKSEATVRKYTPDYQPDLIDRIPGNTHGAYAGLVVFMLMFGWAWGAAAWVFHVVAYILLNSSINSICHMIGYRNWDNLATNHQWIALLTAGEGLHNNHHQYPSSARFALKSREIDPAWPVIWILQRLGLATVKEQSVARAA